MAIPNIFDSRRHVGRATRQRRILLLLALGAALALAITVGVGTAAAEGMTVDPEEPADHHPGEPGDSQGNASYVLLAVNDVDIDYVDGFEIRWEEGVASKCYNDNLRTYGIDRGDTQDGEGTDEEAIQYTDRTSRTADRVYVDFYPRDAFVGETTHLDAGDELVLAVEDCIRNPSDPGWYQQTIIFNGTMEDGSYRETTLESNYVWICECENESEAREELGAPPDEGGDEPTPTATPTGSETPTETAMGGETPTKTATPTESDEDASATTSTEATTETATGAPTTATATVTATAAGSAGDDDGPNTPASADGTGFGALVAALAAAMAGLLARGVDR